MAEVEVDGEVYPSFIDVYDADVFLGGDILRAGSWSAVTDENIKGRALTSATRQLLRMPWVEVPTLDGAPEVVREVTAMLAADLIAKPKLFVDASGQSNVKSVKAGSASVDFFSPTGSNAMLPIDLWTMLVNAGLMASTDELDGEGGAEAFGICEGRRPITGRWPGEYYVASVDYDG